MVSKQSTLWHFAPHFLACKKVRTTQVAKTTVGFIPSTLAVSIPEGLLLQRREARGLRELVAVVVGALFEVD